MTQSIRRFWNHFRPSRAESSVLCTTRFISMSSQADQASTNVTYHGKTYNVAREGCAEILDLQDTEDSKTPKGRDSKPQSVFYNPIQQYNRDLSVLAIKAFGDDLAVIRKARHERRKNDLGKGDKRGKKRKRPQDEGTNDEKDEEVREDLYLSQIPSVDGNSKSLTAGVDGSRADREAENGKSGSVETDVVGQQGALEKEEHAEMNGHDTRDPAKEIPKGPKNVNDGITPSKQPTFRILDALSATGLRALRYAKEIPMVTSVTANDLSSSATASICLNVEHNKLTDKIVPITGDAIEHMHLVASQGRRGKDLYTVIDLDPYGTAAPFLDAAVQAIVDGGMLCVTCTDAAVFASMGYLEKTYSQYGGLPLKGPHAHEGGLRLILHAIATSAARYGMAIEPLLSLSIDFYARVFVRIRRSAAEVKHLASKTMIIYGCDTGCGAWTIQHIAKPNKKEAKNGDTIYTFTQALAPSADALCEHCGFKTHLAGPMWAGHLHNPHFIRCMLDMLPTLDKSTYGTIPRIEGMLTIALNESIDDTPSQTSKSVSLSADRPIPPTDPAIRSHHPFFFLPTALARVLHCVSPSDAAVRGALLHLGYRTARSHTKAGSICTDAPWSVIWEMMREWVRQKSPVKEGAVKERTAGWGIMQKDRSKSHINDAKEMFQRAVDNPELKTIEDLKKDMEAALYRVSKAEEESKADTDPNLAQNGDTEMLEAGHAEEIPNPEKELGAQADDREETADRTVRKTPSPTHPSKLKIVFDEALGKEPLGKRMVRYQINPRPDWGPMNRAKGGS